MTLTAIIDPASKFFQLEEMEDKETCATQLFLEPGGVVAAKTSETDGPIPKEVSGTWSTANEGKSFEMTINRAFGAGGESSKQSDMGEFKFSVDRRYEGDFTFVGESLSVTGDIHSIDETFGDMKVGWFNMIDTTDARLGAEKE